MTIWSDATQLPNGWELRERDLNTTRVFIDATCIDPVTGARVLARVHASIDRIPGVRRVYVRHYMGATDDERRRAVSHALKWANGEGWRDWPIWRKRRIKSGTLAGRYAYGTSIGTRIDELATFEALTLSLTEPALAAEDPLPAHHTGATSTGRA